MTVTTSTPVGTRVRIKADASPFEYGPNMMMGLGFLTGAVPGQESFVQDDEGRYVGVIADYPTADQITEQDDLAEELSDEDRRAAYIALCKEYGIVSFVIDGDPDPGLGFPFNADVLEVIPSDDDTTPAPATGIAATNASLRGDAA